MAHWRERAIREVRDELDRFLNFPLNQAISLGDYGTYDGKRCRFEWLGSISDLDIKLQASGFQHEIAETYATAGVVDIQGRLGLNGGNPSVDIKFRRSTALAFRGYKIGYDQIQLTKLADSLNQKINAGLRWDRDWIIVTQIWKASGFTHLVSGGKRASIQIEATAADTPSLFNYADPSLGLQILNEQSMSYCAIGATEVIPYFSIHKLRLSPPRGYGLYRYG